MMWGCFMGGQSGDRHCIEGIMKKEDYHNILVRHAIPSVVRLDCHRFIFQADNNPKHTAK